MLVQKPTCTHALTYRTQRERNLFLSDIRTNSDVFFFPSTTSCQTVYAASQQLADKDFSLVTHLGSIVCLLT